jgi:hypothetical protein
MVQDAKEELQKKERIKEAEAKRREKAADVAAKERVRAQIKADQEERRLRAAKEKAEREGREVPQTSVVNPQTSSGSVTSKPASAYTESRLRLQLPDQTLTKTYPVDTTLFEVAQAIEEETGLKVSTFSIGFPRKSYQRDVDFGQSLKEVGMVPSMALIVR